MIKKILLFLLVVLVIIQFIHPKRNESEGPQPNYIGNVYTVPDNVEHILEIACFDCHSNNTKYPWYAKLQPVDWWMDKHVREGKKHLNLDEYTNKSLRYQYHKMEETVEMIEDGHMPLNSYTWMHKEAKLDSIQKNKIIVWANTVMDTMKGKYPLDSLIRRK
jgi:hypothetical protein